MIKFKTVFLVVMSLLSIAVVTHAAEVAKPAVRPLQQPLMRQNLSQPQLCPSLLNSIKNIVQQYETMRKTSMMYAPKDHVTLPGIWDLHYPGTKYKQHVESCCSESKAFSIQDQKSAGCSNSDTVKQCVDKLVRYCIGQYKAKAELKEHLGQSEKKSKQLSTDLKQLSQELDKLTNIMP